MASPSQGASYYGKDGSGRRLRCRIGDGEIRHRPGRDLTFSAPKSVSLAALVGGDERIVEACDWAVGRAAGWFEKKAAETRVQDGTTGCMVRAGDQKTVIAAFRHPDLREPRPGAAPPFSDRHMLLGADAKWRTMANESLRASKMLLNAMYRSELASELAELGYGIEKTHAEMALLVLDGSEAFEFLTRSRKGSFEISKQAVLATRSSLR